MKARKDYILTFLTEFITLLAGVLVYRLATHLEHADDFATYALGRRIVSFVQPVALAGLAVSVPRFVASAGQQQYAPAEVYLLSALKIFAVSILFMGIIFLPFSAWWQFLFFGAELGYSLVPAVILMVAGIVFHVLVYGYLRGIFSFEKANLLQFLNIGLVPVLAFFITKELRLVFWFTGCLWMITPLFFLPFSKLLNSVKDARTQQSLKELLDFGLRRIPGDIAYAVLFAIPPFLLAHLQGLKPAGYLAFGITLVNIAGAAFGPLSLILLPRIRVLALENNKDALRRQIVYMSIITFILALAGVLVFEFFAREILTLYLDHPEEMLIKYARYTVPACIGFALYVVLRSFPDAIYNKAVNARSILITLLFFLAGTLLIWSLSLPELYLVVNFTLALTLLGILTLSAALKIAGNSFSV